jgi:histidinol-phosphate/aromatic aminotransferase/cobyric acid decarboxylase-like protein
MDSSQPRYQLGGCDRFARSPPVAGPTATAGAYDCRVEIGGGVDALTEEQFSADMLRRHAQLEELQGDGDSGNFLSGWQCENPFVGELSEQLAQGRALLSGSTYHYIENDAQIAKGLMAFHEEVDGRTPAGLFAGEGATALISTTCAWLQEKGTTEVFYIPPLYFTAHSMLRLLRIRARPISGRHAYEDGFTINLPEETSVLFLSDPVWYAGIPLQEDLVDTIAAWQRKTGSFVIVDGSFQYMKWDCSTHEPTSRLDPDRTIRIICPTKSLAMHGLRFAYATLPKKIRPKFAHTYANLYGSSSAENLAFARLATKELSNRRITNSLVGLIADRHARLRSEGKIAADWQPSSGYFIFEKIMTGGAKRRPLMDGTYFEQKRYPNHRRINLLSPSLGLLG